MLKTECPKCKGWIVLPFQTGTEEITCSECSEPIPVKDVHVSAGPFMIYREALTGNWRHPGDPASKNPLSDRSVGPLPSGHISGVSRVSGMIPDALHLLLVTSIT